MKLGVALPIVDIGGEPETLREFAEVAEEIGYQGIAAPDHVLGVQCREPARLDSGPRTIDRLVSRPVNASYPFRKSTPHDVENNHDR
jgi:hypothetical protein